MNIFNNDTFFNPVRTLVGQDKIKELPSILDSKGCNNPLYIVSRAALASGVSELLDSDSTTNHYPLGAKEVTTDTIASLVDYFNQHQHDSVVGIGGGTILDIAKITRLQLSLPSYNLQQLEGTSTFKQEKEIPLILIPTTIGSGSGATKTAYLRKTQQEGFMHFSQSLIYPDITILDTKVSKTVAGAQTALSVAAILTRAIGSLTSTLSCPTTNAYAYQAIRLLATHAYRVVNSPHDAEARLYLALASQLAGMASSHTGTSLAHTISVAIAQTTTISYAQCMFIILPHALNFNLTGNESVLERIEACLKKGDDENGQSPVNSIATICNFLYSLTSSFPQAIPLRLYDIPQTLLPDQLGQIAKIVYGSLETLTSKQTPALQDIVRVLEAAYWGYPLDRSYRLLNNYPKGL